VKAQLQLVVVVVVVVVIKICSGVRDLEFYMQPDRSSSYLLQGTHGLCPWPDVSKVDNIATHSITIRRTLIVSYYHLRPDIPIGLLQIFQPKL
jgi:hypothetical protein